MGLYHELASVYDFMYQQLFDYDTETTFYQNHLLSIDAKNIIEFGCGAGHLGLRLIQAGYEYLGVDISGEMVILASKVIDEHKLKVGDIRHFNVNQLCDAALFTGRAVSYLNTDNDISEAFSTVSKLLKPGGLFMFDAIDGPRLFSNFTEDDRTIEINPYMRIDRSYPIDHKNYIWRWEADYYEMTIDTPLLIGKDEAILRGFDRDFLSNVGHNYNLTLLKQVEKDSYMWHDHYYVFQKNIT